MHEHDSILRVLYKDVKPGKYDFVCFNGDMTTSIDAESELMDHYLTSSSELFASDTPLYVRAATMRTAVRSPWSG